MKAFSGRAVFCADLAATAEAMDNWFGFHAPETTKARTRRAFVA
jgi:hypothetical protein